MTMTKKEQIAHIGVCRVILNLEKLIIARTPCPAELAEAVASRNWQEARLKLLQAGILSKAVRPVKAKKPPGL